MGTLKANSIHPTTSGNNLILRTGSSYSERIRMTPAGEVIFSDNPVGVSGSMSVTGSCSFGQNLGITGNLSASRVFSSIGTTASSPSSTLTTKGYVDSIGIVMFENPVVNAIDVPSLQSVSSLRQTLELHPHVPETAKYVILSIHAYANGNTPYNIWFGNTTTTNTGHRTHYQTDTGTGDATTNSVQAILPINKISPTSRVIYWNIAIVAVPVNANDDLYADIVGYVI